MPPGPRAAGGGDRALLPPLRQASDAARSGRHTYRLSDARRVPPVEPTPTPAGRPGWTPSCCRCSSRKRARSWKPSKGAAGLPPQARRPGSACLGEARPYAQGQRPHGRPDGCRRSRLAGRAGDQSVARADAPGQRRTPSSFSRRRTQRSRVDRGSALPPTSTIDDSRIAALAARARATPNTEVTVGNVTITRNLRDLYQGGRPSTSAAQECEVARGDARGHVGGLHARRAHARQHLAHRRLRTARRAQRGAGAVERLFQGNHRGG